MKIVAKKQWYELGIDGKRVPRVTTILNQLHKEALVYWAANCAVDYVFDKITEPDSGLVVNGKVLIDDLGKVCESARKNFRTVSKEAMDIGSTVHDAIEAYLRTGTAIEVHADCEPSMLAFWDWEKEHKLVVLATEMKVATPNYAGRGDIFAMLDGKTYYIDLKTSKAVYPEYRYQVAAYRNAANFGVREKQIPKIEGTGILRLDKETGIPEWVDTTDTADNDYLAFDDLVRFFHRTRTKRYGGYKE